MLNIFKFIFIFTLSYTPSFASDPGCVDAYDIFVGKNSNSNAFFKEILFKKVTSEKLVDHELIIAMIHKNPDLMFYQSELKALEENHLLKSFRVMQIISLERNFTHPTFSTYTAQVQYRVKGQLKIREAYFRTNNKVLIPYPEQRLKSPTVKDYIVYRNIHGDIEYKDLTLTVIDSLDEYPKFSRGMSEIEKSLWKKNILGEIYSGRNSNGTLENTYPWRRYKSSTKVHFALKGFDFYGKPHIDFTIPKSKLKELYELGYLRITPYTSDVNIPRHGMPKEVRTVFGLEVEFIVYTEEAKKIIAPYIQAGL